MTSSYFTPTLDKALPGTLTPNLHENSCVHPPPLPLAGSIVVSQQSPSTRPSAANDVVPELRHWFPRVVSATVDVRTAVSLASGKTRRTDRLVKLGSPHQIEIFWSRTIRRSRSANVDKARQLGSNYDAVGAQKLNIGNLYVVT